MNVVRVLEPAGPLPSPPFVVGPLPPPSTSSRVALASSPLRVFVPLRAGDRVYGLGAGAVGTPTRNGQRLRLMNRDTLFYGIPEATYATFPLVWVRHDDGSCFVVAVLTSRPLDCVVDDEGIRFVDVVDGSDVVDVVVIDGAPAEILGELRAIFGASFVPPAWALGFHQSRWSYRTAAEVLAVADDARAADIPLDVVHLDIHMMDAYRVFSWHPRRFADPTTLHAQLAERGVRTMAIIDPGLTTATPSPVVDELRAIDGLLKTSAGDEAIGTVWPGDTVFPDYGKDGVDDVIVRAHRVLTDVGVAGFWNDMNDPVLKVGVVADPLAEDIVHGAGPHLTQRNLYANQMATTTTTALEHAAPGQRHFVLSRSGFLGIQRHAALWTGDNFSSWQQLEESLHMVLHLGLCGVPLSGADIGGFGGRRGKYGIAKLKPSAELFVRWLELGALLPFCRVHSVLYGPRQEPWSFSAAVTSTARRILRRRYALLGLLNTLAREASSTGVPIVRPLWLHGASSSSSERQFLLGADLLVAPVLDKGARRRDVWLPPGSWVDTRDGAVVVVDAVDGRVVDVAAEHGSTPIFARAGSALFTLAPGRNADDTLRGALTLEVFAPQPTSHRAHVVLDDGVSAVGHVDIVAEVVDDDGVILVDVAIDSSGFTPVQSELRLRVPAGFSVVTLADGRELMLTRRQIVDVEGADADANVGAGRAVAEVVVPLTTGRLRVR
ncbi:MAG TPA: TIM-barrel domain-containing protein [Myxococcota bacterium]